MGGTWRNTGIMGRLVSNHWANEMEHAYGNKQNPQHLMTMRGRQHHWTNCFETWRFGGNKTTKNQETISTNTSSHLQSVTELLERAKTSERDSLRLDLPLILIHKLNWRMAISSVAECIGNRNFMKFHNLMTFPFRYSIYSMI